MGHIHTEAAGMISAPPEKVYAVLADYHEGHPSVLPKAYFKSLIVEEGGRGAGTVIHVQLSVMGVRRASHMRVSEPEPGRVLAEMDLETGMVTRFIVTSVPNGHTHLRITTDWESAPGLAGWIDRLSTPLVLRHIYALQLRTLNDYLQQRGVSKGTS
jgi:hypothetical protein